MEDAVRAIMIAFSTMVFVMALSLAMYLINRVTRTSEFLTYYSDTTRFYDNIELDENVKRNGNLRYVSAETIIPTLYRYNKENFCVKIYDAHDELIQIFDLNLEGKVFTASKDNTADENSEDEKKRMNFAYRQIYGDKNKVGYYMFGVPWLGNAETIKARVDLFVTGQAGFINNTFVDYRNNTFKRSLDALSQIKKPTDDEPRPLIDTGENETNSGVENDSGMTEAEKKFHYSEEFLSYSYAGQTFENSDGDVLVTGADSKDKIVIVYKLLSNP